MFEDRTHEIESCRAFRKIEQPWYLDFFVVVGVVNCAAPVALRSPSETQPYLEFRLDNVCFSSCSISTCGRYVDFFQQWLSLSKHSRCYKAAWTGHKWTIEFTTRSFVVPTVSTHCIQLKWSPIKKKILQLYDSLHHFNFSPQHYTN